MKQVMERRDDNWKKLQQYILDEREEFDVRGPGGLPLWGGRTDYTWFIRDGFFVRSPLKVNGVTVGEDDRRKSEADYLRRAQNREKRDRAREAERTEARGRLNSRLRRRSRTGSAEQGSAAPASRASFSRRVSPSSSRRRTSSASSSTPAATRSSAASSSKGRTSCASSTTRRSCSPTTRSAGAGGRSGVRIARGRPNDQGVDDTVNRLLNKGSRVTLWIEPAAKQIVKYTFDNVDMDFFPAQWIASVTGGHASMTMGQPFPDVWLPRETAVPGGPDVGGRRSRLSRHA